MQITGSYDLNTRQNCFSACDNVQSFSDEKLEICTVCTTNSGFASELALLYLENGMQCTDMINDMYMAVIFDRRDSSLHIFADITTSALNMYYAVKDNTLYYSTSLKKLLIDCGIKRSMNLRAAKAFLANGYVFGSETLINNIHKLKFGCEITVENEKVLQKEYTYTIEKLPANYGKKNLMPSIEQSVRECIDENAETEIFMPLSGGFDSNMILNTIKKSDDRTVNAITVGGKAGKNEVDAVRQNVSHMSGVVLNETFVDTSFYNCFADIVWRLEGFVFESGVFLQYALAKSARENGAEYLICGEGSDETQSVYYYESLKRVLGGEAKENEKFFIYSDPFIGTNMLILKKSSLMLNSFGIAGKYPFKNKRVAQAAVSVSKLNGTGKKYYKNQCKKEFLPQIVRNLKTTGGTTGNAAAVSPEQISELSSVLTGNPLLSAIAEYDYPIHTCGRSKNLRRKQYFERGIDEIKNYGLIKGLKKTIGLGKKQNAASLLKKAYLVIFDELFISGKYDASFTGESSPVDTQQIIRRQQ
ncbi:MAG: hypothetical protein IKV97_00145 [Clostridia bacterium]|nr:hypothetical protein [Clostridia bacterium]